MHSQEEEGDSSRRSQQLPSLTQSQAQARKSSLRSLQEIQQRRSAGSGYQSHRSRQRDQQLQQLTSNVDRDKYPTLLNMSQEREKGRSLVEGSIYNKRQPGFDEFDERSQMIHQGVRVRSPSDTMRRQSKNMTPSRLNQNSMEKSSERHQHLMAHTSQGVRSSFKLASLAPLDGQQQMANLAQTSRLPIQSNQQIGPLFQTNGGSGNASGPLILLPTPDNGSSNANSRIGRIRHLKGSAKKNSQAAWKLQSAMDRNKASTFEFHNAQPKEVSDFLQQIIQEPISLALLKPGDLDSTEALDSFLDTLYLMIEDNVCDFNEAFQQRLHLATGMRTDVCEDLLMYFAQLQTRNKLLSNAVQFFGEHLTKISQLEGDKELREKQVALLIADKEALFLTKYDLERKLADMSVTLRAAQASEEEAARQMKSLQKRLEVKVAECESLVFRIKHMEEVSQMLEPPLGTEGSLIHMKLPDGSFLEDKPPPTLSTPPAAVSNVELLVPSPKQSANIFLVQESEKMKTLESTNKRLESELTLLREALKKQQETYFKENIEHFGRIQELYNKVQTENKQLRVTNKKVEARLEAKERLVSHLEAKVTQVMVEKEDVIVRLKSDIVLLRQQIEENEKKFEQRIAKEITKFQKEFQSNFSSQEKRLKDERDQLVREKADLSAKINQLQNELEQLASEFSNYRTDITKKDLEKEQSIGELQSKLKQSGQLNETQTRALQERIEAFNNQNLVLLKQNQILDLKMRLLRDSVEALYRQKAFVVETIEKSGRDLAQEAAQVQTSMLQENGNREYLVSVKKAVNTSQAMVDLGLTAIAKVAEIVSFLKIEEVRSLVLQHSGLVTGPDDASKKAKEKGLMDKLQGSVDQQQEIEKLNMLFQQEDIADNKDEQLLNEPVATGIVKIHNFFPLQANEDDFQREEHYYNTCPVELGSILSKALAESLIKSGFEEKQVPIELMKLVSQGQRKADPAIEQEIFQAYLAQSTQMMEERYLRLTEENTQLKGQIEKMRTLVASREKAVLIPQESNSKVSIKNNENLTGPSGTKSRLKTISKASHLQENQLQEVSNTVDKPTVEDLRSAKREGSVIGAIGLLDDSTQYKRRLSSIDSRLNSAKRSPIRHVLRGQDAAVYESTIEHLKIQIQEQKLKHREVTLQLAGKIVLLEEQLDEKRQGQEAEFRELEAAKQEELDKTKQGIQQREDELLKRTSEFKARADQAENEVIRLQEQEQRLFGIIREIELSQTDFRMLISQKEEELVTYKENVSTYVNLKVSQRNMFGLTLEISKNNESMINEAILKYYLHKCLRIDKDKFRFISTEELVFSIERQQQSKIEHDLYEGTTGDEQVTVIKVLIEIVDDEQNVERYLKQLKTQIREGKSILYDLQPLYLSINLGQCGIHKADQSLMRDYHLIRRRGVLLRDENYIISVLRHRFDPLQFKIIAASADLGEEFILDLQARDLFELTEGRNQLLEVNEPSALVETLLDNLSITINQETGVKALSLEHRIYFSALFAAAHMPQEKDRLQKKASGANTAEVINEQASQDSLAFRYTSFRNQQILTQVATTSDHVNLTYKEHIQLDASCQTDSDNVAFNNLLALPLFRGTNTLPGVNDEVFVTTYQGYQRVGKSFELKVKIDEGQKSGTIVFTFEEIRTRDKCQVCMLDSSLRDRYVLHTECVKFQISETEEHLMLLTFERFQEDGFLVKLHDMKFAASEEMFLVKKSNGQYARLTRSAGIEALISNGKEHEELRNLIFDLTFTLSVPSQQILYANLSAVEQQILAQEAQGIQAANSDPFILPTVKRAAQVKDNSKDAQLAELLNRCKFSFQAIARYQQDHYSLPSSVLLQKHERGDLLYRNVYSIRCFFEENEESEHKSLISFYVKKDAYITVEVFLFKEAQKMSIASQVSTLELFGPDYGSLSFYQKTEMLDQMMEKLYVLSEQGQYHLKVENDAVPMSVLIEHRKQQALLNTSPEHHNSSHQGSNASNSKNQPIKRQGSEGKLAEAELAAKLEHINKHREQELHPQKSVLVKSYAQLNDVLYEYRAFFILKAEKEVTQIQISPSKKKSHGKKQIERQTSISNNIEDMIDFDYVLVEANDTADNHYQVLLNVQKITKILMSNPYELQSNWQMIQNKDKDKMVEFLKHHTKVDEVKRVMTIDRFQPSKELVSQMFTNEIGGVFIRTDDHQVRFDLEKEVIEKKLLMNQEVDMAEYTYDVKLYQVFNRLKEKKALSYCFEIFSLNEPELMYRYIYALHEQSSFVHSPIHIGYDVVNLIENDLSRLRQNEESARRQEFQSVVSKYIDNKLLVVINEQLFPHQISFCLFEPSSRLHWSYTFSPQNADTQYFEDMSKITISNGRWNIEIGQLSILDQATAERFLAMTLCDAIDGSSQAKIVQSDLREDSWADLGDNEILNYDLLKNKEVHEDIILNMSKIGVDLLSIEVKSKRHIMTTSSDLSQQSFNHSNQVKFLVNATQRDKFICKLLRLRDQPATRLLVLTCSIRVSDITVKIIELTGKPSGRISDNFHHNQADPRRNLQQRVLYQYTFKEKRPTSEAKKPLERKHIEEAIAEACTSGSNGSTTQAVAEKASRLFDILANKERAPPSLNIFEDKLSVSQRRMLMSMTQSNGIERAGDTLVLHRKTFFDESHEKLIIVSVSAKCTISRKKGHGAGQQSIEEVDKFKLTIQEPETQRDMEFELLIGSCFLEEELLGGLDLRNIAHLKRMARVLVEERAVIKRVAKDSNIQITGNEKLGNLYTVEINLSHITPMNPNGSTPRSGSASGGQVHANNNQVIDNDHQSLNRGGSKSKITNSLDNAASSSIRNVGLIPEDEGGDEFEAMESAIAAKNVRVTSGQTNLVGSQLVKTQQSFKHGAAEMFPVQQSVIEEEGSQEEFEDSPNVTLRYGDGTRNAESHNLEEGSPQGRSGTAKENKDRYSIPNDNEEEELENESNEEINNRADESVESQLELLFERQLSDSRILQIFKAPSGDPYSVFYVQQRNIQNGQVILNVDIDQDVIESILERCMLPPETVDQLTPELLEAVAEYVISTIIRKQ